MSTLTASRWQKRSMRYAPFLPNPLHCESSCLEFDKGPIEKLEKLRWPMCTLRGGVQPAPLSFKHIARRYSTASSFVRVFSVSSAALASNPSAVTYSSSATFDAVVGICSSYNVFHRVTIQWRHSNLRMHKSIGFWFSRASLRLGLRWYWSSIHPCQRYSRKPARSSAMSTSLRWSIAGCSKQLAGRGLQSTRIANCHVRSLLPTPYFGLRISLCLSEQSRSTSRADLSRAEHISQLSASAADLGAVESNTFLDR